jgi:hypothetical protein
LKIGLCGGPGGIRVLIPDSRGEEHGYRIVGLAGLPGLPAVRLTRDDGSGGYGYELRRLSAGSWSCTCPSWRCRPGPCKHCQAAELLEEIVRIIGGAGA